MSNDVVCRKCGQTVSEKSIREGWHECDEVEAMGDLRDRIVDLESVAGRGGRSYIEAIAYATAALGYAVAGKVDLFNRCMGAAVTRAPFAFDFEPVLKISWYEMAGKAAELLDAIGDEL